MGLSFQSESHRAGIERSDSQAWDHRLTNVSFILLRASYVSSFGEDGKSTTCGISVVRGQEKIDWGSQDLHTSGLPLS